MNGIKPGQINRGHNASSVTALRAETGPGLDQASLPNVLAADAPDLPLPQHTLETVKAKHRSCPIGSTRMEVAITEMAPVSPEFGNHHNITVTLTGPTDAPQKLSLFNPLTWGRNQDRAISLTLSVGSDECPDWGYANSCLTAIKLGLQSQEGKLSRQLVDALKKNFLAEDVTQAA